MPSNFLWEKRPWNAHDWNSREKEFLAAINAIISRHGKGNLSRHLKTVHRDRVDDRRAREPRRPLTGVFHGCLYRATQKCNLTTHIRRRHNEARSKTIVCSLCPATFYEKTDRRNRIQEVHVNETVNSCNVCHRSKNTRESLQGFRVQPTTLLPSLMTGGYLSQVTENSTAAKSARKNSAFVPTHEKLLI